VPVASVPMKLPSMTLLVLGAKLGRKIPLPSKSATSSCLKRLITNPRIVVPPPVMVKPLASIPAGMFPPLSSISKTALVVPSVAVFSLAPD
jgi:hypothetical protein